MLELTEHFHSEPEQGFAFAIVVSQIERRRVLRQTVAPAWADFNFKEAHAARPNFVLMWNASRTKMQRVRPELRILPLIAFAVFAFEQ